MKAKDKQVIKFMSHGTYESVAGISCAGCVAHKDNEVTSLCKAISKFSNCEGVIWKEQVNTSQPQLWHTAITSSKAQKAVQHNVTILIRKITSLCKKHHYIAWPPDTFCPLLFVRNDMTGAAYHGQADNFCEVYDGISPEMLYFYSTSDEEF